MPGVIVYMAAGWTPEQKKKLMEELSETVVRNLGVDIESVVVQIVEAPLTDKMKGGKTFVERRGGA